MANFAQIDENNVVINIIVVSDDDTSDNNGVESESIGIGFCQKLLGANTNWKKTTNASIGDSYNASLNAFVSPKPHASWTLDSETASWVSPLGAAPTLTDDQIAARSSYFWDESAYQADNTTGWVLNTMI
jgi:hypothetical protein